MCAPRPLALSAVDVIRTQGLPLVRDVSVQQTSSSGELLRALKEGHVGDVRRVLMNDSEGLRKALMSASMETEYGLRSPLMAAAATGDGAIYSTVHKAICRTCLVDEVGPDAKVLIDALAIRSRVGDAPITSMGNDSSPRVNETVMTVKYVYP